MNRIKIGKKRFVGPAEWNELSRKQLFAWSGIIRQKITIDFALKTAVCLFYKIGIPLFKKMNEAQQVQLKQTLEFLASGNELTKNVIGSFRLFFKRYHGPANRLSNISALEFRRTELYYQLYYRTKDDMFLNLLCATLFRPKGKALDDDIRNEIKESEIIKRAKIFEWLNVNIKHSILLFYEGCRTYIFANHKRIFSGSPSGGKTELNDFEGIILAVSGDKFGNFEETGKTNLYRFLKHLEDRKDEADRLKNLNK